MRFLMNDDLTLHFESCKVNAEQIAQVKWQSAVLLKQEKENRKEDKKKTKKKTRRTQADRTGGSKCAGINLH